MNTINVHVSTASQNEWPLKHISEYDRGELAKEILKGIALGGFILACFVAPNVAQVIKLFKPRNSREHFKIKRTLETLQKQRLVDIKERGSHSVVTITESGKSRVLRYNLENLRVHKTKRWDGYWRVVMFDIPDKKKKVRKEINFRLKEMGFVTYQESVFINPYECKDEIEFLREYFFVRNYIKYLLVKEIDDEIKFKKEFGLQSKI